MAAFLTLAAFFVAAVFFSLQQKLLTMERGVRDARFVNDGSTKVVSEFNQGNVVTNRCILSAKYSCPTMDTNL